jgi:cell wall-associated NlpC family hydrolase
VTTGERIVAEAETWLGTPFRHGAGVRGQGADCGMFVLRVLQAIGLVPDGDPAAYAPTWFLHRNEGRFEAWLARYCDPVPMTPQPGDLACFQVGRAARAHLGIVTVWPAILHADPDSGVTVGSATSGELAHRYAGAWRVRG